MKPVYDVNKKLDADGRWNYNLMMTYYNQCHFYHQEGLKLINSRLKGSLTNVIQPETKNIFPVQFTIQ